MSDASAASPARAGVRVSVQEAGRFLSALVMPNIGAFIAWGLITALFIPEGWLPNASLAQLVSPMITYMLPILIGYTGGRLVFDIRGGVIGVVATLGIIGMALAIGSFLVAGPTMQAITKCMAAGLEAIVSLNLSPLANIFIEPGKILFLNNAINHGVLSSIGIKQSASAGKSIVFILESDPGPGMGILLAYWVAGKGAARTTAPSAVLIHFLGGIHEIYFPYVLMSPRLILACIAGGVTGTFTFSILGAGLVAPLSPGCGWQKLHRGQAAGVPPRPSSPVSRICQWPAGCFEKNLAATVQPKESIRALLLAVGPGADLRF